MPKTDTVRIATRLPRGLSERDAFAQHFFVGGGHTLMLDVLDRNREQPGVIDEGFGDTIARTRDLLRSAAAIDITALQFTGNELCFAVQVRNLCCTGLIPRKSRKWLGRNN